MFPCSEADVKQAYLAKAKVMHPDAGGEQTQFVELQTDFDRAVQYCKFHSGRSRWLSESVERYVEQQQVTVEIEERGGRVTVEHLDWLKREIGEDFAQVLDTIAGVRFSGAKAGDADVDFLVARKHLLSTMHWLDLSHSKVTNAGILKLAAFPKLRKIDLRGTSIGNAALRVLDSLPKLEWLGISETGVTWFRRMRLRRRLPGLQIG
ncbi:MAG TPA: hypothetical protein VGJ26_01205 [Pirellulales bacterium]|jgi:hypothetical protein